MEEGPDEVLDYQIENQRGVFFCGVPMFSPDWLLGLDPHPFTDLEGKPVGSELRQLQVPNPTWVWDWPDWCVDMTGQVDYHGWSYNWHFTKTGWHDGNLHMRCFVRHRRWMRARKRIPVDDRDTEEMIDTHDLFEGCRNDRERSEAICNHINHGNVDDLIAQRDMILGQFKFPQSIEALKVKLTSPAGKLFVEAINQDATG